MSGTRISDMTVLGSLPASGALIPVVKTGISINYSYDLAADLAGRPTSALLAATGGAALIGSTGPSTVQADINARPTSATLSANGGAALIGTSASTTVQTELNKIGTKDEGVLPAVTATTPFVINKSASGNSAGNSDWRSLVVISNYTGAYGATQINCVNFQHNILHTAGTVTSAIGWQAYSALGVPSTPTTTGDVSSIRGIEYHISHTGSGALTDAFTFYGPGPDFDVGTGHCARFNNFRSGDISGGSGSNRIDTESYGFFQANSSSVTTPIMAGYGSEMSYGTGRWNLYVTGGASSWSAGRLRIGGSAPAAQPTEFLEVVGGIKAFSSGGTVAALGFGTSAGGTVTQATSKSTGVTLNKPCGQITMNNAALAATTSVSFTLTNDQIAATDTIQFSIASGASANSYAQPFADSVSAGSCRVQIRNISAGSLSEALVLNFTVLKGVTS
jgi:hypothetical protein